MANINAEDKKVDEEKKKEEENKVKVFTNENNSKENIIVNN